VVALSVGRQPTAQHRVDPASNSRGLEGLAKIVRHAAHIHRDSDRRPSPRSGEHDDSIAISATLRHRTEDSLTRRITSEGMRRRREVRHSPDHSRPSVRRRPFEALVSR